MGLRSVQRRHGLQREQISRLNKAKKSILRRMLFFTFFVLFLYYIREKFTSRASASITAAYTIGAGLRKIPLT